MALEKHKLKTAHAINLKAFVDIYKTFPSVAAKFTNIDQAVCDMFGGRIDAKSVDNYMTTKGGNNPLPYWRFLKFCSVFEIEIKQQPYALVSEKYFKWRNELNAIYEEADQPTDPAIPKSTVTATKATALKVDPFLKVIQKSPWYLYQLEKGQILRRVVEFKGINVKGYCNFWVLSDKKRWRGDMRFIDRDKLLVGISKFVEDDEIEVKTYSDNDLEDEYTGKENSYTHYAFRVNLKTNEMTLSVGHMTFLNGDENNVVTKTVILQRAKDESPIWRSFDFKDADLKSEIREFFFDGLRSRLTSPHAKPIIINDDTFIKWVKKHHHTSGVHPTIIGDYKFMYIKRVDKVDRLETDYLQISLNLKGQLEAKYEERQNEQTTNYWEGIINENLTGKTLSAYLEGPYPLRLAADNLQPHFLLITVPRWSTTPIDTLTGVITGIKSDNQGAVSRLFVMTRIINGEPVKNYDPNVIDRFFARFRENGRVRPPVQEIITTYDELRKFVDGDSAD